MSQQFCALVNIVLVSRLLFLHRDSPLTFPRMVGMVTLQIIGAFAFRLSFAWLGLVAFVIGMAIISYQLERRSVNRDLLRPLILLVTGLGVSVVISKPIGLEFSTSVASLIAGIGKYSSLTTALGSVKWSVANMLVLGALVATGEANNLVRLAFSSLRMTPASEPNAKETTALTSDEYRAGRAVGFLERLIVYVLVLKGQYAAIGFVLAAKGLARFKELDERRFAEYVLIGTLLSTLLAVLIGEFILLQMN
jgi:hypothetical protein